MSQLGTGIRVDANVRLRAYEDGVIVAERIAHNVFTNTGKEWVARILGATAYTGTIPTPHNTFKVKYMGFGCGGALQPDTTTYVTGQDEVVTVTALQDPVSVADDGGTFVYLKQVYNQADNSLYFPTAYTARFIADLIETEVSFVGSFTKASNVNVGTSVPLTEAGLYTSEADPYADPTLANGMICYYTFAPVTKTVKTVLRTEWDLRIG